MKQLGIQKSMLQSEGRNVITIKDLVKLKLQELNVPYFDECCEDVAGGFPVRYNLNTATLEYLDGENWIPIDIPAEPMNIYMMAGQSNMRGRGEDVSAVPAVSPNTVFMYNDRNGFEPITTDVLHSYPLPDGEYQDPLQTSLAPSFGITYNNLTGEKLCLVQTAVSGSGVSSASMGAVGPFIDYHWDVDGVLYVPAVQAVKDAIVAVAAAGYKPVFRGILWNQGETEALGIAASIDTVGNYKAKTLDLFERFRTDFGENTPVYMIQIGRHLVSPDASWAQVRQAQVEICNENPLLNKMVFWGNIDFKDRGMFRPADNGHWSTAANNEVGRIIAANIVAGTEDNWQADGKGDVSFRKGNAFVKKVIGGIDPTSGLDLQTTSSTTNGAQVFRLLTGSNGSFESIRINYNPTGVNVWDFKFPAQRGLIRVSSGTSAGYSGFRIDRVIGEAAFITLLDVTGANTGVTDSVGNNLIISNTIGNVQIGGANTLGGGQTTLFVDTLQRSLAIGKSSTPATAASLELAATNKMFVPNRMTGAQAEAIVSPVEGGMIYATDGSGTTITSKGWWGYEGATWVKFN